MNSIDFVNAVRKIAESNPTYRTGGTGKDGTCDCIGLVIGALGKKYDMNCTNYFARYQMQSIDALVDESQLHPGSLVYKSRRDTGDLNARYKPDGRYYTGDMLDYYHVGVVTSIDPLEITHCTSSGLVDGIAYDSRISAWSHFGDLLDVDNTETEAEEPMSTYNATVTAPNGNTVRMRSRPSTDAPTVAKVPIGETVQVTESAAGWAKIKWAGQSGYMMSNFLSAQNAVETGEDADTITIALPVSAARALLDALDGQV